MSCRRIFLLTLCCLCIRCENLKYNSFRGCPLSNAEYLEYTVEGIVSSCVTEFQPCDPDEGRRIDGTCNNLEHPSIGAPNTPFYRLLPAEYNFDGENYEPRRASDGRPLPLSRHLRTNLLPEERIPDNVFTQLPTYLLEFFGSDIHQSPDIRNYIFTKTYCCQPKGKTDSECTPIKVPEDDPDSWLLGIHCFNLTRPISFQSIGCTNDNSTPDPYSSTTPLVDLSNVYGTSKEVLKVMGRTGEKGLLKYEIENGTTWPPSEPAGTLNSACVQNRKPNETRCNLTPDVRSNGIFTSIMATIWFWRFHNHIAGALYEINPCWSDDQLFYTAWDINIAVYNQILYYELFPVLMGKDNLLKDNVISSTPDFRDLYNKNKMPQVSTEFAFALTWFHKFVDPNLALDGANGNDSISVVDLIFRTGWLAVDNNIDRLTQALIRQPDQRNQRSVSPDMAERSLGGTQERADVYSSDLTKNRYMGFGPYINYVKWCSGKSIESFDDLKDIFGCTELELLKENYQNVTDIDLMSGMWLEKSIDRGHIPRTLYCILKEQLLNFVISDRHFFEREERPKAFTENQLSQIRKATISRFMCDVGDKVTEIQPNGFLVPGPNNEICSCDEIPNLDYSAWKDPTCSNK